VFAKNAPTSPADPTHPKDKAQGDDHAEQASMSSQNGDFAQASESIRQAMQDMPDIADLSRQVMMDQTPEGLRIQLVDQDGRPMFQPGGAEPMPYTRKLLAVIAKVIDRLPNRISIAAIPRARTATEPRTGKSPRRAPMPRAASSPIPAWAATASTKWRARPVPSRCCRKTPTPRPTAAEHRAAARSATGSTGQ
jgi:chemotaxis protein MotB